MFPLQLRTWLTSIGFTLLFGGLFSKTYRVYVIFRDHRIRSKVGILTILGGMKDPSVTLPYLFYTGKACFEIRLRNDLIKEYTRWGVDSCYISVLPIGLFFKQQARNNNLTYLSEKKILPSQITPYITNHNRLSTLKGYWLWSTNHNILSHALDTTLHVLKMNLIHYTL